ncbi:hypothetical protein [Acetobacter oryzoeni]|uniref:Uncharacterized protein n=1 Tax=Acetobacter oryzoeni TaxID=2500548 RepID=A0A5B9GIA0_9PROT|nr:hypothetical protein [Acetobacter oryzoeni]MCP1202287.1 hypothetical protein [Acetobacter oryzoeni]QEE86011.1 hypothetical protein EOV40_010035 [Acetobacter oryzoeni]
MNDDLSKMKRAYESASKIEDENIREVLGEIALSMCQLAIVVRAHNSSISTILSEMDVDHRELFSMTNEMTNDIETGMKELAAKLWKVSE